MYRGVVEGVESGHCTARIGIGPGGCRLVDYEAISDAHGLQHIEHGPVTEEALHVAFGEAPGVTVFTRCGEGLFEAVALEDWRRRRHRTLARHLSSGRLLNH